MVIAHRNTGRRRKSAAAEPARRTKRESAAGHLPAKKRAPADAGKGNGAESAAATDDVKITALDLEPAPLSPAMQAYFAKCEEKLGFVPNVLKAYAFDMAKLEAFVAMYNDLMLGALRSVQARARDDRGRGIVGEPLLLLPRGARRGRAGALRRSAAGRADGDELPRRPAIRASARDAGFCREADRRAVGGRGSRPRTAAAGRIHRARHLGHRGGRGVLQHVESRRLGDRYAPQFRLPSPSPVATGRLSLIHWKRKAILGIQGFMVHSSNICAMQQPMC